MEARPVALLKTLLLIMLNVDRNYAKVTENCITDCNNDGTFPVCGAWLLTDNANEVSGIYQLNEGYLNLTCVIKSLPKLTDISWWHRNEFSTKWEPASCASMHNHQDCGVTLDTADRQQYQVSRSTCMLKTDLLIKTGYYRCQGQDSASESKNFIYSAETSVVVAGIEYVDVVSAHLPYGSIGHVEVQFCANPKPEVVWIAGGGILQPGQSNDRIFSLKLLPFKEWKTDNRQGSANIIPYCYRSGLIIGKVRDGDNNITVVLRNEGATRTVQMDSLQILLQSKNVSQLSNTFSGPCYLLLLSFMLVLCLFNS